MAFVSLIVIKEIHSVNEIALNVSEFFFSSPKPSGSQGELIVYLALASIVVVVVNNVQTSSPLKPLGQSKPNFMWSFLGKDNDLDLFYSKVQLCCYTFEWGKLLQSHLKGTPYSKGLN